MMEADTEGLLAHLIESHGEEVVDAMFGSWMAKRHRERPRLFWAKPEGRARAPHYLAFVRQENCCRCGAPPRSDPDHIGQSGMGLKADDYRTIPLCRRCHELRQTAKLEDFDWKANMIDTLVRYLRIVEQT